MSLLKILNYPDVRLRKIAKKVVKIDKNIKQIVNDMFETMYYNKGIGLAAVQVNINMRIITIDVSKNNNQRLILINPLILNKNGKVNSSEGCLSIPNKYGIVMRSKKIKIRSLNLDGNIFEFEADDLLAICIQHELDHLIGKLFIDYLPILKYNINNINNFIN